MAVKWADQSGVHEADAWLCSAVVSCPQTCKINNPQQTQMVDAEACKTTQRMWGPWCMWRQSSCTDTCELAGRIRVDHRAKDLKCFFVAIDPKHVELRLQDAVDSRSADCTHYSAHHHEREKEL